MQAARAFQPEISPLLRAACRLPLRAGGFADSLAGRVEVEDATAAEFRQFLQYLYTDTLPLARRLSDLPVCSHRKKTQTGLNTI